MESAPARPVSANQEEKREEQPRPATKTITEEDWKAALEQAAVNFPLQADFLAGSVFSGHDGTFVTVAFHPSDRQGMDSLASGPLRAALEADLSRRSGAPVALSVRADASVPEPVQEQLEPLPAPPPRQTRRPRPNPRNRKESPLLPFKRRPLRRATQKTPIIRIP